MGSLCTPFINTRTNATVEPATWPNTTLSLVSTGNTQLTFTFGITWCVSDAAMFATGGNQPCPAPAPANGYVQVWDSAQSCFVSYNAVNASYQMNPDGNNEIDAEFTGVDSMGSASAFLVKITCDGATSNTFSGTTYSTRRFGDGREGIVVQLSSLLACGTGAPTSAPITTTTAAPVAPPTPSPTPAPQVDVCPIFLNNHTDQYVDLRRWAEAPSIILQSSGSDQLSLTFGFSWCSFASMGGSSSQATCSRPLAASAYVQVWDDTGACFLTFTDMGVTPRMNPDGDNDVLMTYSGYSTSGRQYDLNLKISCDGASSYQFVGTTYTLHTTPVVPQINVVLSSKYACGVPPHAAPVDHGLSGGAVFVIIVFVGIPVYMILHVAFNVIVGKRRGADAIPGFWKSGASAIKDGCLFVTRGCKGKGQAGYTDIEAN